jgi:5'(3')-deoxyribonucleotidase
VKIQGPDKIILGSNKQKKEFRIFIDLDGVLSDFEKAACKLCDLDIEDPGVREHLKSGGRIDKYVSDDDMWAKINEEGSKFWENLELFPWAKDLYNTMKKKSDLVAFLTSPSYEPDCAAGKVKWITKNFDTTDFIITPEKHFCATPNSILIDDSQAKLDKFAKYGGNTFLWPNSLVFEDNNKNSEKVIEDLVEYIDELL